MTSRRWPAVPALVVLAALVCGCSTLPTSGAVHTRPDDDSSSAEAPYFAPPGPTPGDTREGIVRGFLLAMQANPPSIAVAREFLSSRARATWKPDEGTVVYDGASVQGGTNTVDAILSGAHRLDPRGGWDTGSTHEPTTMRLSLVRENGQWRIDDPPDTLAVPESDFASLFVPFDLYFFDRTGTVLVPTRVYLPRGQQTATNLVRALLAGPGAKLTGVVRSAFPSQTDLDLAVVVNDAGVAEVPLGPSILDLSPADLNRAVVQLAWTLGQVSGVNRLKLSVDGAAVPLPDGETEVGVREGSEYDPVSAPDASLVGIAGKRVVRIDGGTATPVGGPFGRRGFALRTVALDADRHQIAAVAGNGRKVFLASDRGSRSARQVRNLLSGASDVLRPWFDRFGGLWLVDRAPGGAVVHVLAGGHDRVLSVPGISGRRLSSFALTRDGTRMLATLVGQSAPQLLVASLVRDGEGRVVRARAAEAVDIGADLGQVRDVTQSGPTTAAVLSQPASGPGQITTVELDGSPGDPGVTGPTLVPGPVLSMAISPDPHLTPWVTTAEHLLSLASSGRWIRSPVTGVRTAAYPQ